MMTVFALLLLSISSISASAVNDPVTAVTLNIRYDNPADGENAWPHRQEAVIEYLEKASADFIGLQEATPPQLLSIAEALEDHGFIARTRERNGVGGEATPLFWRTDRWTIDPERNGTTWLSATPDVPGSRSWDSSLPRIVTWGRFTARDSGRAVWIYNTHFDHRGPQARLESGRLLARLIGDRSHPGEPVLVMGDFNCAPDSKPIMEMQAGGGSAPMRLVDVWSHANPDEEANATWNGWKNTEVGRRIDLILVSKDCRVMKSMIQRPLVEGRPISDHWPVKVIFELPAAASSPSPHSREE